MINFKKITKKIKNIKEDVLETLNLSFIKTYVVITAVINLFSWIFCYLFATKVSQKLVVLHYNVDFGVDLIGDVNKIFVIPFLGLFVLIFNFMLIFLFLKNENFKFLIYLLLGTALLVNLFLFLSLGPIYLINFR